MAPKKKGGKKAQDDWEADLGEDPTAQAETAAKEDDAAGEDEVMGGGLLAMLKKNRGKKVKKGKVVEDFVEGEDPSLDGADAEPLAAKAPVEATFDDEEDIFSGPIKKSNNAKAGKTDEPKEDDEERDASGRVMTKKEKEKAKKEREKQRKKEQAAKKKTTAPAPAAAKAEPPKATPEVKEDGKSAPAEAPGTGGKKKKINPALLALQKKQEELRKREEEAARLAAEEKARIEELERMDEEEKKRREEERAAKKLKEKQKIAEQKKAGTYKTKAQKEAETRAKERLQQMMDAGGVVVEGKDEPEKAEKSEKAKPKYAKKKGGKSAKEAQLEKEEAELAEARERMEKLRIAEEAAKAEAAAEAARLEAEAVQAEESDELDDWEAEAAKLDAPPPPKAAPVVATKAATKSTTNGKPAQAAAPTSPSDTTQPTANGRRRSIIESSSSEEDSSDDEAETTATKKAIAERKALAAERRKQNHEAAMAARSKEDLRSPICCILGHVDTGKTKLLDKIRQTNVQEGEAGGITQQIGATYFPVEALQKKTAVINTDGTFKFNVPGLLVIDTPGHESFSNLRSRGSSLCNIAILVVDIMHGLEPQTLESMKLLRDRKTPFIVALNKIDRLFGWKKIDNNGFRESLELQNKGVQGEFKDRLEKTKLEFAEKGFNAELFYENKNMARYVSLVPTSAHTGEGIPDMLKLLVQLTQERMTNSLMYLSEVEATVLEVKVIEGLGTTIDVILSNGILKEGDRIVVCGLNGAITTNIRALLTPAEMKELRVKSAYVHNKEVKAAIGVKISADGLDSAIAGSRLLVVGPDDDEEDLEDEIMGDLENLLTRVSKSGKGVSVQASTLGSLEALLEFLKVSKIPVANIGIGPVYKRDVMQAGVMLERSPEHAIMLCFDVKVDKDAAAYAAEIGVKIFTADIIYHLFDAFNKHMDLIKEQKKEESKLLAVFPCVLRPIAVFNKKDPIVVGLDVVEGVLKPLTPICAIKENPVTKQKEIINMGRVTGIEREHKQIPLCKKGQPSVAVKIEGPHQPMYGRQLEEKDTLYSLISRESIDTLKEHYRADVSMDEWSLIKKLKPMFDIS